MKHQKHRQFPFSGKTTAIQETPAASAVPEADSRIAVLKEKQAREQEQREAEEARRREAEAEEARRRAEKAYRDRIVCTDPLKLLYEPGPDFETENGVLRYCRVENVHIRVPDGVTAIGADAWKQTEVETYSDYGAGYLMEITQMLMVPNTSVRRITLPDSVTDIGAYAFRGCSGLTEINIPASVTSIGAHAFDECRSLSSVTVPQNCQIAPSAFPDTCHIIRS